MRLFSTIILFFLISASYAQDIEAPQHSSRTKWEAYAFGGFGLRTARVSDEVPPALKSHMRATLSGYAGSAGVIRYFNNQFGLGVRYAMFGSQTRTDNLTMTDENTGQTLHGSLQEQVTIQFLGPAFHGRTAFGKKDRYKAGVYWGFGYIYYTNQSSLITISINMTGGNIAHSMGGNIGLDLGKQLTLSLGLSAVQGKLNQVVVTTDGQRQTIKFENDNEKESLQYLEAALGLRWHFGR